jgi:hypothetical protein
MPCSGDRALRSELAQLHFLHCAEPPCTTRKLRFRESEKTVMKYWFTLMKTIREGQPSRMSTHGIEAREIEFS